ncbi:MAG: cupin [Deltaproteobacteria bacterium]|nr:cupin [Deltaproteobacteria bacterium]
MPFEEAKKIKTGGPKGDYYRKSLERSKKFRQELERRKVVIKCSEMPWEKSPQGLIKHIVNEEMFSREFALDMYMQLLEPGKRSGKHRHMAEEVFYVLEGRGYDLHWDVEADINIKYEYRWAEEPKRLDWAEGDFVYIPPYTTHQHFNTDPNKPARILSATNRLVRALGFDWLDQVEDAPE